MKIEKPISTIRELVKDKAVDFASEDSAEKLNIKHYENALNYFRILKLLNPDAYKSTIKTLDAENKLKKEVGSELYEIFNKVWAELIQEDIDELNKDVEKTEARELSYRKINKEIFKLKENHLKNKIEKIKNNSRIINAFKGKEKLFRKCINVSFTESLDMIKGHDDMIVYNPD